MMHEDWNFDIQVLLAQARLLGASLRLARVDSF